MGDWYGIGVTLGLGLAAGVGLAAILAPRRGGFVASVLGALVIGVVAGFLVKGALGLPGGVVGALIGAASAAIVIRGAARRGATPGGTAFIMGSAAVMIAGLSLVPVAGYVMAVLLPVIAARRARTGADRHAGLRTLAK